jgi:hypothetical protein
MTFGRRPEIQNPHPVGLRRDKLEVLLDTLSRRELAVSSHAKTEMILRGGDLRGERQRRRDTEGERYGGDSRGLHGSDDTKRSPGVVWTFGSAIAQGA